MILVSIKMNEFGCTYTGGKNAGKANMYICISMEKIKLMYQKI